MLRHDERKLTDIAHHEGRKRGRKPLGGVEHRLAGGWFGCAGTVMMLGGMLVRRAAVIVSLLTVMVTERAARGIQQKLEEHMRMRVRCAAPIGHRCADKRKAERKQHDRMLK